MGEMGRLGEMGGRAKLPLSRLFPTDASARQDVRQAGAAPQGEV